MSQENVDVAKTLLPAPDADLAALFRDEHTFAQARETIEPLLTDDFESVVVLGGQTTVSNGVEGLRKNWLDWLAPWATYRTTLEGAIDVGDRVLLLLRNHGRLEGTDAEVELIGAAICTVRAGKIARWEDYAHRAEALEAVGLSE